MACADADLARIEFIESDTFGVLDHHVVMPAGTRVCVPMRVVPNGTGSELIFTLFRLPNISDRQFEDDVRWALKDLTAVKRLLEDEAKRGPTFA